MKSKFAIGGHPIHPALVAIPIGLFAWTLVSDLVYLGTDRDKMWYDIAFWSGIAAIVTGLVAALPGFGDYLTMASKSDAKGIALAHMVLNVAVIALFFLAMLLMLDANALNGGRLGVTIALHAVGVGALLVSGWLGGEMVFRHHLAVIPDDSELESAEHERHSRPSSRAA